MLPAVAACALAAFLPSLQPLPPRAPSLGTPQPAPLPLRPARHAGAGIRMQLDRLLTKETELAGAKARDENAAQIQAYSARAQRINALEDEIEALSDEQLRAKTAEFRARLQGGATLDELLEEAFAVVREAAWRTLDLRHYDVQLVGAMALNDGKLAQMGTCLLYTSPSPRDQRGARMPSSA